MRVIAGRFRGRPLHAPRGEMTRPTTDRVREAVFAVLGDLAQARVLDLYAGSGAIGIEALSRGAAHAVFVEAAQPALACIRRNLQQLDVRQEATVIGARVERCRGRLRELAPFDLVYCDPPWAHLQRSLVGLRDLLDANVARAEATVVVEHPSRETVPDLGPGLGQPFDRRVYGDTALSFFRVPSES